MKKFVLFISLFALSVLSVQARENKLYFTVEPQNTYIRGLCNNCKGVFIGI